VRPSLPPSNDHGVHRPFFFSFLAKHIKSYQTLLVVHPYVSGLMKLSFPTSTRIYALYMTRMENLWYVCRGPRAPPSTPI